jgi:hypothetical protein
MKAEAAPQVLDELLRARAAEVIVIDCRCRRGRRRPVTSRA